MSWYSGPSSADYAWAAANDANSEIKKLKEQIRRLQEVVAKLATEMDDTWEYVHYHNQQQVLKPLPIPSAEEMVELTLYPENFEEDIDRVNLFKRDGTPKTKDEILNEALAKRNKASITQASPKSDQG